MPLTNWAGNVTYRARRVHRPTSVDELRGVVAGTDRLRALGTGHAFNRLADTTGDLVSVAALPPVMDIDTAARTVTVAGGIRYGELAAHLHAAGWALHNLGSLPHLSVAGACATATHGSGVTLGNLSTAVAELELVTAGGELVTLRRGTDADFAGSVVGLGSLGVVTRLALDIEPAYQVRQYVYENLPRAALDASWEDILAAAYSVSLFTDWTGLGVDQVWRKHRVEDPAGGDPEPTWWGATLAAEDRHPIASMSAVHCTEQRGMPGPWHTRLPHFRLEFTPSAGRELQSEYLLAREDMHAAFAALDGLRDRLAPVTQVSEIRTIAADELWLSPSYRRDSVAFHFTWVEDAAAVTPVMAAVEERLAPFAPRPHWGKLFGIGPEDLSARYPRWSDFAALLRRYDAAGKLRNEMIDRYFPG
jgi:xylitol oxidase